MNKPDPQSSRPMPPNPTLARRVMGQGALLFAGFAGAQAASFTRNAFIGHWLSKGDFGIAATITLALQLLEILSDLGVDRLIVQARNGGAPRNMAAAHTVMVARGILTAALLFLAAAPLAAFFGVESALWAFQAAAIVPLIKSFIHLDYRRAQRRLENRPFLMVEAIPQLAAAAAAIPVLQATGNYAAVVWLAIMQAAFAVLASHLIARRAYRLGFDGAFIRKLIAFGWPIWLSAFPLVAVFQGDRIIVARAFGMEELAGYSAAFMITMVPGLIAAKVGHALMLPLLAEARGNAKAFAARFALMSEATALTAAAYLAFFVIAGGAVVPLAFGAQYQGLGVLTGCLALMWALRMVQAVPGMALMAGGSTAPLLTAGIIRALALIPAAFLALHGAGLAQLALAGCLGELASLIYLAWRIGGIHPRLGHLFMKNSAILAPVALAGFALAGQAAGAGNAAATIAGGLALALATALAALILSAHIRSAIGAYFRSRSVPDRVPNT